MCEPDERLVVEERVFKKIVAGKWIGARNMKNRPQIRFASRRTAEQVQAGLRAKPRKGQAGNVSILAYHAVLLKMGKYPTLKRNVCSHLCHNSLCVDPAHLVWSDSNDNDRREKLCRKDGICRCGLVPPCTFECEQ